MKSPLPALDFLGAVMSADSTPDQGAELRVAIVSQRIPWTDVDALARRHFVVPALYVGLRDKQLLEATPPELVSVFKQAYRDNAVRNLAFKAEAVKAIRQLNHAGVEPALLKGMANIFDGVYSDIAVRAMADIDLLIPRDAVAESVKALRALGYQEQKQQSRFLKNHHHYPELCKVGNKAPIELHWDLLHHTASHILPSDDAWNETAPVETNGFAARFLSPTHRILHNVLHAQVVNQGYARRQLQLRGLYDFALLTTEFDKSADWHRIAKIMESAGKKRDLVTYVYSAQRIFNITPPDGLHPTLIDLSNYYRVGFAEQWQWLRATQDFLPRLARGLSRNRIQMNYDVRDDSYSLNAARVQHILNLLKRCFFPNTHK